MGFLAKDIIARIAIEHKSDIEDMALQLAKAQK
jgi:hypothetical protein